MKKIYFPNLDGLRFFAFFAVFLAHSFYSESSQVTSSTIYQTFRHYGHLGMFGVNFFFVLSGFLITFLLIIEKQETGAISLKNFYVRRVLRIWPLYYAVIFIGFVIIPIIQRQILAETSYQELANIWHYLLFVNNFSESEPTTAVLGVLWSIAVEEQFYLVWPILIALIPIKRLPTAFIGIIGLSMLCRLILIGYGYKHTLSCMSDLAMGSLFAYYSYTSDRIVNWFGSLKRWHIGLIYVIGISLFFLRRSWSDIPFMYLNERLLFSLFFVFIILEQNYSTSPIKMHRSKIITSLGKITYGLYMLHFLAIYVVAKAFSHFFEDTLTSVVFYEPSISLILSVGLAYVSYTYFEKFFLRMKKHYS